ncbi:3'-5' exonuclease [Pedobacter xixiisoli]|uniref:Exonuclease n=1 Tax=Pedobacter xixiisoli TaxID=1476464 RepID=A0A285ZXD7_9SPHI|nr:3'-5' exonuclease [Pedobacter xixiisoli]SOD14324.1 Exonuclease [Pedobacter xixiisoli]
MEILYSIINELYRGLWYIFVSTPAIINEEGASKTLLILFSLVSLFQIGFWYSALLIMFFPDLREKRKLNVVKYVGVSIAMFFICLVEYAIFENLYIGFLLGFIISPSLFIYNYYPKKEKTLRTSGLIGSLIGLLLGIIFTSLFVEDPQYFAYPIFAGLGGFFGWIVAFYLILWIVHIFNIYTKKEADYFISVERAATLKRKKELEAKQENERLTRLRETEQKKQQEIAIERERILKERNAFYQKANEDREKRLREERNRVEKAKNIHTYAKKSTTLKKYLFFDTETSDLPKNYNAPPSDTSDWPRLVQLGFAIYDENRVLLQKECWLVKPNGFLISAQATEIHKITTEKAMRQGLELSLVLNKFNEVLKIADYIVCHNVSFDENIMLAEMIRTGKQNYFNGKNKVCTMKNTTNYCKIVSSKGYGGYKWPSLSELHFKLFNSNFSNAHNAIADVEATVRCFWKLKDLKVF